MLLDGYSSGCIPQTRSTRIAEGRSYPFRTANRRIVNLQQKRYRNQQMRGLNAYGISTAEKTNIGQEDKAI